MAWDLSGAPVTLAGQDGQIHETRPTNSLAKALELDSPDSAPAAGLRSKLPLEVPRRRSVSDHPIGGSTSGGGGVSGCASSSSSSSTSSCKVQSLASSPAPARRRHSTGNADLSFDATFPPVSGRFAAPESRQSYSGSSVIRSSGSSAFSGSRPPRRSSDSYVARRSFPLSSTSSGGAYSPEDVLIRMGFDRQAASAALAAVGGDVDRAVQLVLEDAKAHGDRDAGSWEFEGDAGWVPFGAESCATIERAQDRGLSACELKIGGWRYLLDFDSMMQLNLGTKRSRRIRPRQGTRSSGSASSATAGSSRALL